ncbi:MAG: hypothetical protein QXR53_04315 [Candidatus Norongarragalinales archaeon]
MLLNNATAIVEWNDEHVAAAASVASKAILASFCLKGLEENKRTEFARKTALWLVQEYGGDFAVLDVKNAYSTNNTPFAANVSFAAPSEFSYGVFADGQHLFSQNSSLPNASFVLTLPFGIHNLTVVVNDDFARQELDYANNSKTIVFKTAPSQADLRVDSIELAKSSSQNASGSGGSGGNFTLINASIVNSSQINATTFQRLNVNVYNNGGNTSSAKLFVRIGGNSTSNQTVLLYPGQKKTVGFFVRLTPGANQVEAWLENQGDFNYTDNSLNETVYYCNKPGKTLVVEDSDVEFAEESSSARLLELQLRKQAYCVDYWSEQTQGQVYSNNLTNYRLVVWSAGNNNGVVLNEGDFNALSNYSGPILLEGADVGFDHQNDSVLDFFGVGFKGDLDLNGTITPLTLLNHPILYGIENIEINGSKSRYPDKLALTNAQGIAKWPDGNYSIVARANAPKKIYFAFAISAVQNESARANLLGNAIAWLQNQ